MQVPAIGRKRSGHDFEARRRVPGGVGRTAALAIIGALASALLPASGAWAAPTLQMPDGAIKSGGSVQPAVGFTLPVGPWAQGSLQARMVQGEVTSSAWHLPGAAETTLQIFAPLKDQLLAENFKPLFECATDACGGFDFRYAIEVLPEPQMHVDLGDFLFLSAERISLVGPEYVTLLVSRSTERGFVQLVRVGAARPEPIATVPGAQDAPAADPASGPLHPGLAETLEAQGYVELQDLVFATGSSELDAGRFESLAVLAAYLKDNPRARITLVGHTDADGSLAANIALSERRARSVAERLIAEFGVSAAQLASDGVGYLAPRASNLTDEGRRRNRRVEAMLAAAE